MLADFAFNEKRDQFREVHSLLFGVLVGDFSVERTAKIADGADEF